MLLLMFPAERNLKFFDKFYKPIVRIMKATLPNQQNNKKIIWKRAT